MIKPFDIEQVRTSKTLKRACLVLKPCESFNVIGWLRKNFATPECLQEEPGNGAFSEKKSAVRMWEFISFIIRTGAHWTRELDSKFALQRLFLHFYVILYYDSKYMCITTIFLIRKVNWGKCDYMVNFMDFCRWAWDICVVSLCQAVGPRGFLFFFFLRSVASAILKPGTASNKLPSSE